MNRSDCFHFGYVSKSIGLEGELIFFMDVDDPGKYKNLKSVFIEINNELVPFFIESIKVKNNFANIKLEGITTQEQTSELIKQQLYLPLHMLPPLKANEFYYHEVIGFKVIDKNYGEAGVIESVLDFPQQNILQVKNGDKEILIPVKKEFILKVDRDKKVIEVETPDGLIEMYLENNDNRDRE